MSLMKKRKGNGLRAGLLVFFGLVFCVSAFMASRILLERRAAENAYASLRENAQTAAANKAPEETEAGLPEETIGTDGRDEPDPNEADADSGAEAEPVQRVSMDFGPIREQSPDITAWIIAEGTPIDYPVMQADDNDYYLTHLYDGEYNSSGSIFLDCRNSGLFKEENSVIYGHHMKNGSMFASLDLYKDQDFYDAHPTMFLYTPNGDYLIELICGTVEDGNYEFVQFDFADENDLLAYVESHRGRSTFQSAVETEPGDRFVSLCTCSYERNNARFMLMGKLTPIMADPVGSGS